MDRFDLEQHILQCWEVCEDIETMVRQEATLEHMVSLSTLYRYKFKQLFSTYTTLVHERQLITKGLKDDF